MSEELANLIQDFENSRIELSSRSDPQSSSVLNRVSAYLHVVQTLATNPFSKRVFIEKNSHYRDNLLVPQRSGLTAIESHDWENQRMIVLDIHTGCGKSGIIALAPYILEPKRVLIITPQSTIREQLHKDLKENNLENFYCRRNIFDEYTRRFLPKLCDPYVYDSSGRRRTFDKEKAKGYPLCILNAQSLTHIGFTIDNTEMYDLIIIDEAHHYPANTWRGIVDYFETAKVIFLTGTPYRSDGQQLPENSFEYKYNAALSDGLIKKFVPVYVDDGEDDGVGNVIRKTIELLDMFDEDRDTYPTQRKAIALCSQKTNDTEQVRRVCEGFNNYDQQRPNIATVINAEENNTDNFMNNPAIRIAVVVKMLNEGFDFPPIAVAAIFKNINTERTRDGEIKGKREYIQFVGRAVRRIRENNENDTNDQALKDKRQSAYVISPKKFELETIHNEYVN